MFARKIELKPIGVCDCCQDEIYPGDMIVNIDGWKYCQSCVLKMKPEDVLDICGYDFEEAKRDAKADNDSRRNAG